MLDDLEKVSLSLEELGKVSSLLEDLAKIFSLLDDREKLSSSLKDYNSIFIWNFPVNNSVKIHFSHFLDTLNSLRDIFRHSSPPKNLNHFL